MSGDWIKKLFGPLQWSGKFVVWSQTGRTLMNMFPFLVDQLPRNGSWLRQPRFRRAEGWHPVALRPIYLLSIAALMFLMVLTLEGLRRYSEVYGGLVYYRDTASVSYLESFAYNYVPIIVGIIMVTLWSFVDFDVLRLEPYFQLSRPEGVPASVLFINYNFGQSIITPITSAKRHHWIVLSVSLFTMMIRMSLPALQSTLFELREVTVYADETMRGWPDLISLKNQETWMIAQGANEFDSVLSSHNGPQRSRSSKYAVGPVEIPRGDSRESTVWSLNQTVYWAEPSCLDVLLNESLPVALNTSAGDYATMAWNVTGVSMEKFDGSTHRCELDFHYSTFIFSDTDQLQVRYWEPVSANTTLLPADMQTDAFAAVGCDPFDIYGVLIDVNSSSPASPATSGSQYSSSANIFACNVLYYSAEAEVSMHANSSITGIKIHNETTRELTADRFNIPKFQELLSQRAPYTSDLLYIAVNETSGDTSVTELPVISQKVGDLEPLLILDTSTLMTDKDLQSKVVKGVKQAFVLTMDRLFDPDEQPSVVHAKRLSNQVAITTVGFAAFWSETILAVGTLLTLGLVFIYHRRPNILKSDPGSIAAMCSLLADVFSPANILSNPHFDLHQFSTRQLRRILRNSRLRWQEGPNGKRLEIVPSEENSKWISVVGEGLKRPANKCPDPPMESIGEDIKARVDPMPHFLLIPVFILEFLLLTAVIAAMALIIGSLARNGKFRHLTQSDSSFLQVILSVLPSMVASAVGSLSTSIHRNLSILEPWVHLQRGMASAQSSLSMNYSAQTPWAVLYKTIRDRHLLLGLVSLACVVNTALTVVAGGLFTQRLTTSYLPTSSLLANYSQSTFLRTDFAADFTEYDLIQSSITSGVPMLPWTSANYSFVPVKIDKPDSNAMYGVDTLGIGADLDCEQLDIADQLVEDAQAGRVFWEYRPFFNPNRVCKVDMTSLKNTTSGISLSIHFLSPQATDDTDECQTSTVVVLGRWNYKPHAPVTDGNTVALHCEPRIKMGNYSIIFDQKGQINTFHGVPHTSIEDGPMYDNATASIGSFNKVFAAIPQSYTADQTSKNGSYVSSYDWAGFLVGRLYERRENNITSLNAQDLIETSQIVYQWVYGTYFSIWREIYLDPLQHLHSARNSTVIYSMWCMDPSVPSLVIALVIIAFDTLVVLVVFGTRRGRFKGPRIPRSIGAVIPWLAHSRMLNDFPETYTWKNTDRRQHLSRLNKRYAFRMFLSPDGRWRFAVDEEPTDCPAEDPSSDFDPAKSGDIQLRELGPPPTPQE